MKLTTISLCLLYVVGSAVEARPTKNDTQADASKHIAKWQKQYNHYIEATLKTRKSGCTSDNIVYRREWGSLSKQERIDYTDAVLCLQKKPPISSITDVPGVRSHYDDFVATHIIYTPYVHFSGLFFHFHRYFIWLYEKSLREECGYKGTQPYWDWTLSWEDPRKSTVFDGSATSVSGNGISIPHGPTNITAFGINVEVAPATGGGCVPSGPFKDYTLHLGPVAFGPVDGDNGLAYNPRCLNRDISLEWSKNTKPTDVVTLLESCEDLGCFDTVLEGINGVHASGHFIMGGTGMDPFSSAGDPAFYLHHAQVDRMWTIWQNLNARNRTNQVYGTGTAFNVPPSSNVTLNTHLHFGVLAQHQLVGNLASSIDGPFCYMYV